MKDADGTEPSPNWLTRYFCAAEILAEDRWLTSATFLPRNRNSSIAPAERIEAT